MGIASCVLILLITVVLIFTILVPMLRQVRAAKRQEVRTETCMSNLSTLGRAMMQYAQDYDDTIPPASRWMDAASGYVQSQNGNKSAAHGKFPEEFHCPAAQAVNPSAFGYALNRDLSEKTRSKIKNPLTTPFLYDSSNLNKNASDPFTSLPTIGRHKQSKIAGRLPTQQNANSILFLDNHADVIFTTK